MYHWYINIYKGGLSYGDKIALTELGKILYMKEIKEKIKIDKFNVIPREKNEFFINRYLLDKNKIKNMLLSLKDEDMQYELEDKEYLKYGPENLIVFKKQYELIDMYGIKKCEEVYIKIKMKDNVLPIISLHIDE